MDYSKIKNLGQLKKNGYQSKSIKEELRQNLIAKLKNGQEIFGDIWGFEDTVIPDIQRAILSRHNILLLGLRGQAKTKIARKMTELLDEYIPIVSGSEINDDPLQPLSRYAIDLIEKQGDKTPIEWLPRDERYVEKLATPDVSVADLIGDVDPIKAATLKLSYADERVLHFGLVPRAHRCLFVLNELPDLQARIQVSLFNILQEGDIQIRGFKLRLPLDIQFIFTANPEDYTNRGSIVTPLKDRIASQILTHYPKDLDTAINITRQEARLPDTQCKTVTIPDEARELLELISFHARDSEYVDEKSGVSARMSVTGMENLVSTAERRALINGDQKTTIRLTDFWGIIPSITGKMELVYEGEQEGPYEVATHLINEAIKELFSSRFPNPDQSSKRNKDIYESTKTWFTQGNELDLMTDDNGETYQNKLISVNGLQALAKKYHPDSDQYFIMELILNGLAGYEVIGKSLIQNKVNFSDPLAGIFGDFDQDTN